MSPERAAPSAAAGRTALPAALLALALLATYLANGGALPGNDATPSAYLAAHLAQGRGVAFTPSRDPQLFDWRLERGGRVSWHLLPDLDAPLEGRPARDWVREGALTAVAPYFLVPSGRRDPASGEVLHAGYAGFGAALAALPVFLAARAVAGDLVARPDALWWTAKLAAALMVALAAAAVFLLARRWLEPWPALLVALAFGLGTPAWSVASQTLWQHPASQLFLALGTLAVAGARGRPGRAALAGLAFAAAAACRPTSALFAAGAAAWLLAVDRRGLVAFAAGALPIGAAQLAWNAAWMGGPLHFGQTEVARAMAQAKTGVARPWQPEQAGVALAGLLLSPSRGLLVFSPLLALAVPGAVRAFRRPAFDGLRPVALGALALLAVEPLWFDWWGGWSYGWRRLADLAPALCLLLVPVADDLLRPGWRRLGAALLLAWAVALQALGAVAYDLSGWNARSAWRLRGAAGAEVVALDDAAARAAQAAGARLLGRAWLDVDQPEWRHRLWSVADSAPVYYATHLAAARANRAAVREAWLQRFRPPPPPGAPGGPVTPPPRR
jgi:hypothetical protein